MKSIIYFLAVLLLFSCKPREQKINPEYINGRWAASEAVMFTSLDVSDSSILVGNRADTIFTVRYSISHDTLITYAPFTNQQFKNKILLLTKDTLVLGGIMDVKEERHYSRRNVPDIDLFNFPSESLLITPRSIGNIVIGMTMDEVKRNYQHYDFATVPAWDYCLDGGGDGVVISKDKEKLLFVCTPYKTDSVSVIIALSPKFYTADGLRPTISIGHLFKLYPNMTVSNNMLCSGEFYQHGKMIFDFVSSDSSLVGVYEYGKFTTSKFDTTRKINRISISKYN